MANTINYNLQKPPKGTQNWNVLVNENFDIIDEELKNNIDKVGVLNTLNTANKTDLVSATNEVVAQLADNTKLNSYIENRVKPQNYLSVNAKMIACFGDSITAGNYNYPNDSDVWYPTQLMQLLASDSSLTIPIASDTTELADITKNVASSGVSVNTSTGIFTLTSSAGDTEPRFLVIDIPITSKFYTFKFDVDTTNAGNFPAVSRIIFTDNAGNAQCDELNLKPIIYNTIGYKNVSIIFNAGRYIATYPGITKLRVGFKLTTDGSSHIVTVKNISVKESNELYDVYSVTAKSGVTENETVDNYEYILTSSSGELNPRFIKNDYTTIDTAGKYLIACEVDNSLGINNQFSLRLGMADSGGNTINEYQLNTLYRYNLGAYTKMYYLFDPSSYLSANPTLAKIRLGSKLVTTIAEKSIKIRNISFKKLSNYILVNNYGINGETTSQAIARISTITSASPSICICGHGTNDIRQGVLLTDYLANLTTIINTLKTSNIVPIIATMPPLANTETNYNLVSTWNIEIKYLCAKLGVQVLDRWWSLNDGDLSLIDDGRHPTSIGYIKIANSAYNILTGNAWS